MGPLPMSTISRPTGVAADDVSARRGRSYDVVLYGATGFVGRLTARHLTQTAPGARIALAGRDRKRLEALNQELGGGWPLLVVDPADPDQLRTLAVSTAAVASAVGRHGLPMARACAVAGTSYADLSGEVPFVRASIDQLHEIAVGTGARIVHGCGFNAVPSDIGAHLLHEQAQRDGEGSLTETTLILKDLKGGFSGGNLDSNRAQHRTLKADPSLRSAIADPWVLTTVPQKTTAADVDPSGPFRDHLTKRWLAPALGGPFNSRLVRRSASLRSGGYGPGFHYREGMSAGHTFLAPAQAVLFTFGFATLSFALTSPVMAPVMDRLLPPGSGPSDKTRRNGRFRMRIYSKTSTGAMYVATVAAKGDPGYAATSVMLGESVLSLATDSLSPRGGVLTPAIAMGNHLSQRLITQGFEMSIARI
jgi:short subunit dehydrogenase-like uncharacterized protein